MERLLYTARNQPEGLIITSLFLVDRLDLLAIVELVANGQPYGWAITLSNWKVSIEAGRN